MILNKERIQGVEESRVQVNVGEGLVERSEIPFSGVPSRVFLTSGDHEGRPYEKRA